MSPSPRVYSICIYTLYNICNYTLYSICNYTLYSICIYTEPVARCFLSLAARALWILARPPSPLPLVQNTHVLPCSLSSPKIVDALNLHKIYLYFHKMLQTEELCQIASLKPVSGIRLLSKVSIGCLVLVTILLLQVSPQQANHYRLRGY